MQILYLAHRVPYPPDKGERIRAFHELKYLGVRHDVDLCCFADSHEDAAYKAQCQDFCRSVYVEVLSRPRRLLQAATSLLLLKPMSSGYFYSRSFASEVLKKLGERRYDIVFVYCSSMGQFVPEPAPAPLVVDFVDADSAKWKQYAANSSAPRSWLYAWEGRRVAEFERTLAQRSSLALAVTTHDAEELGGGRQRSHRVRVLPNGVEVPVLRQNSADNEIAKLTPFVVFVGTMNYKPNTDAVSYFAREIFPLLRGRRPQLNFVIVGRDPAPQIRKLGKIPGITITGTVPDVYAYLRHAEASVAPFRISQGFHNKIVESLAAGTPVVTSTRAAAGIGLRKHHGLLTADDPKEFAQTVEFVLGHPELRRDLRRSLERVREGLSWDTHLNGLDAWLTEIADGTVEEPGELAVGRTL
jgi:sugar transferase (PEP-CTERM/EpsH1 system associated)